MDALQSWWKRQGGGGQGGPSAAMRENAAWPLVDRATADILLAEDFAANLEVSDFCNASVEHATLVARAIVERLRCRSPKSVKLALSLVEMCVKNGNASALHTLGGTREFMTVVADVATGKTSSFASTIPGADTPQVWLEVQERALEVIQELGQLMQDRPTYPGFYETYASLTARGIIFPVRDAAPAAALAADPVAFGAQHSSRDNSSGGVRAADIDKLEHDLSVLECKLQVADHLLCEGLYGDSEEMLDVLDFLLQCKPRLCELIEASAQGLLSDMFFESCLQMNDRLCATVDRIQILPSKPRDALVDSEEQVHDHLQLWSRSSALRALLPLKPRQNYRRSSSNNSRNSRNTLSPQISRLNGL
ncbi:Vacuolar protein sorting-associated protein 27 [Hondaea fermentalgiana]|uniref:Vacuolar protein sorting-associated protein 27 n=1 Tax=Hondaea fermentalgiana TaxID=2315210 RepID=A0A2R5GDM1_9STRA|nr:Vacuolar protein sorting-associated protein 27 [Hondaea fermentalgiana]|eukprot:GBG28409.1 Vacuolar protein sorting-associated protein 27 [Hondaea fermentalgiana]